MLSSMRTKRRIPTTIILRSCSYQYLQQSKVPTMYFQRSLPRLPIPALDKTCERFLNAVRPIVSKTELADVQASARQFLEGTGSELQAMLQEYDNANKETSYISKPWFEMYLRDRTPLPLNYNPLMVMKNDERAEYQNQIVRATNLVISSLRFWRSFQANMLEPEIFRLSTKGNQQYFENMIRLVPARFATYAAYAFNAFPLDMSQYHRLFGVTRIPALGKDILHQTTDARHILVLKGGRMYAVNVLDQNGNIESPRVIYGRLKSVEQHDKQYGHNANPLGVLTTQNRDNWALHRQHLESGISENNKDLLTNKVDGALFCLCLDSADDPVYDNAEPTQLLKHLLAGNATNRWFDKSVSLIVSNDGTTSVNFEHSWGDGVAVLRYFNEIYTDSVKMPFVNNDTIPEIEFDATNVRMLNFDVDDQLRNCISQANEANLKVISDLEMNVLRCSDLNKVICKNLGLSPDFIMQLSFQLAYRLVYGEFVGTYESCSTAAFRHGRTETMRPCTIYTKQLCDELIKTNQKLNTNLVALIKTCSTNHSQLVKEAAMGQGFDRHLYALKNTAENRNIALPNIYNTEAYKKINYNIISTSTLSSSIITAGAFGPVVKDGFGIGYSIQNEESGAIITSYKSKRNGTDFVKGLEVAQKYIKELITSAK